MYKDMTLSEMVKLPGINDLPGMKCKGNFAQALKLEEEGKHTEANIKLDEAIQAEQTAKQTK